MYLNQLGLKAKTDKRSMVRKLNNNDGGSCRNSGNDGDGCRKTPEVKLPPKKKILIRDISGSPNDNHQVQRL
jgi:hypothetical protein